MVVVVGRWQWWLGLGGRRVFVCWGGAQPLRNRRKPLLISPPPRGRRSRHRIITQHKTHETHETKQHEQNNQNHTVFIAAFASGGHVSPSVSLAAALSGHVPWGRAALYAVAQVGE